MVNDKRKEQWIAANREEYGADYANLRFLGPDEAARALERRSQLLAALGQTAEIGCDGTKLDMRRLSPGCRICTEGKWSCLFINGRCNCSCFYCPTSQDEIGLPTTNTVEFRTPAEYLAYLERLGFSGASISGGEPLLTAERSLAFVAAIKRRFGANMHVWLYTNGTRVNNEILRRLADAGLDEIRFDIGATDYKLDKLRQAVGVIPTVTVEIPAIPHPAGQMKTKLVELAEAGVNHLNLHQLRLTPYNYPQLIKRGYTYLHGEKVTVLDSELEALELLAYTIEQGIDLPLNYCSFVYKHRFQAIAARRRNGQLCQKDHEQLSAGGYLRTLTLLGSGEAIFSQAERFAAAGCDARLWARGATGEQLCFAPNLWPLIDFERFRLLVSYSSARQMPSVSYRNPFVTVRLGEKKQMIVERMKASAPFELSGAQIEQFAHTFLGGQAPEAPQGVFAEMAEFEGPRQGLQDYY